jgi:hypothetical protein
MTYHKVAFWRHKAPTQDWSAARLANTTIFSPPRAIRLVCPTRPPVPSTRRWACRNNRRPRPQRARYSARSKTPCRSSRAHGHVTDRHDGHVQHQHDHHSGDHEVVGRGATDTVRRHSRRSADGRMLEGRHSVVQRRFRPFIPSTRHGTVR